MVLSYLELQKLLKQKFDQEAEGANLLTHLIKSLLQNYVSKFSILSSSLIEEDLILQELILQRSLLELENGIKLVGCTPTAIWRRTGELCYINNEFLSLTGFDKYDILSQTRFIFEFWDHHSIITYFNMFQNVLAFGDYKNNTSSSHNNSNLLFGNCNLKLKNSVLLSCAACWTVRRDSFNIPDRKSVV